MPWEHPKWVAQDPLADLRLQAKRIKALVLVPRTITLGRRCNKLCKHFHLSINKHSLGYWIN